MYISAFSAWQKKRCVGLGCEMLGKNHWTIPGAERRDQGGGIARGRVAANEFHGAAGKVVILNIDDQKGLVHLFYLYRIVGDWIFNLRPELSGV
jgi:hypothetical protein